jgi:AGCS family alanine or glycine:cation symporter
MWVVAFLGMATALVEATTAQLYKVAMPDGTFRGGPAYYLQIGLGSRPAGKVFAVLLIFTFGFAFEMVQANTIADTFTQQVDVPPVWVALALAALVAPVLFGGVRRVAKVAEVVVPAMALTYVLLAVVIVLLNLDALPGVLATIVGSAFGFGEAAAGVAGGLAAAVLNGARRGLFSNEAGMGSAPNMAATATVPHPVDQGLVQSLGVFVDTMLVCSATAFIILVSGPEVYVPGQTSAASGAALTSRAVEAQFGPAGGWLMLVLVFVFAFSSVLGNYSYAEVNLAFLRARPITLTVFRWAVVAAVAVGALLPLSAVWSMADIAMAGMTVVNLTALVVLSRWALGALRDWERQRRAGQLPRFVGVGNDALPGDLPGQVWAVRGGQRWHGGRWLSPPVERDRGGD